MRWSAHKKELPKLAISDKKKTCKKFSRLQSGQFLQMLNINNYY